MYISKGPDSDPTDLDHDLSILQVKSVNLTTQDVLRFVADGGYSVAIYLSSSDEVSNELLDASMNILFSADARRIYQLTLGIGLILALYMI